MGQHRRRKEGRFKGKMKREGTFKGRQPKRTDMSNVVKRLDRLKKAVGNILGKR